LKWARFVAVVRDCDQKQLRPEAIAAGSKDPARRREMSGELRVTETPSKRRQLLAALALLLLIAAVGGVIFSSLVFRDTLDSQFQSAIRAFREGDFTTVVEVAEKLRPVKDYEPHVHLLQGMLLLRSNRAKDAVTELSLAHEHPATQEMAWLLSGEAFYRLREFSKAEQCLKAALAIDPEMVDAHRWLGAIYYDIGAMNQAVVELELVAEQDPEDPRPHRLMGVIYQDFEEYPDAIEAFRESLRRDSKQADAADLWLDLANCQLKIGALDQALDTLDNAPDSPRRKTLEAACLFRQGKTELARQTIDAALEQAPNSLAPLLLKGRLLLDTDAAEQAVQVLTKSARQYPNEYEVHELLSEAYKVAGKDELAESHFQQMQRLKTLRLEFNRMHLRAIEDPSDDDARYQLGLMALQLGKPQLAHRWFATTLAMNPNHTLAREALQKLVREFADAAPRP
jgi:tetratricopeptide (TPR) repeat protein